MHQRLIGIIVASATLVVMVAAPTSAAPKKGFGPIDLTCANGETYQIVVSGNSDWSANHVIGSNKILVPLAFSESLFAYTDPQGNGGQTESLPDLVKGNNKNSGVWCDFVFDINTGNGLENFSGTGKVELKIAPPK